MIPCTLAIFVRLIPYIVAGLAIVLIGMEIKGRQ